MDRAPLVLLKKGVRIYDDYESGSKFKTWGTDLSLSVSTFQLGASNLRIHMHRIAINIDQPLGQPRDMLPPLMGGQKSSPNGCEV